MTRHEIINDRWRCGRLLTESTIRVLNRTRRRSNSFGFCWVTTATGPRSLAAEAGRGQRALTQARPDPYDTVCTGTQSGPPGNQSGAESRWRSSDATCFRRFVLEALTWALGPDMCLISIAMCETRGHELRCSMSCARSALQLVGIDRHGALARHRNCGPANLWHPFLIRSCFAGACTFLGFLADRGESENVRSNFVDSDISRRKSGWRLLW